MQSRGHFVPRNKTLLKYIAGSLVLIFVVALTGIYLVGQTTIYNRPEVEVITTEMTIFATDGTDITADFEAATISNTITFEIKILSGWDRVHGVTLVVEGISEDASPGGYWSCEQVVGDVTLWRINFDTAQLNNGQYKFDFYYTEELPPETYGGEPVFQDTLFSTFQFQWEDGEGFLTGMGIDPMIFMVAIVIVGLAAGGATIYYAKSKKGRKRRK